MNKEYDTNRMLIEKYLDKVLNEEDSKKAAALISEDAEARETYDELQTAVATVKYAALNQQVATAAQQYFSSKLVTDDEPQKTAKVVSFRRVLSYSLSAAAAVLLIVGSYTFISYQSVNKDSLYSDAFVPYDIAVTRNSSDAGSLEAAYMQQNWQLVVNAAKQQTASQKANFLAGVAALQLHQYQDAQGFFENLVLLNQQNENRLYADDTDYYLALAYLKLGEFTKAKPMIDAIRSNPYHQYYQATKNISSFKLKLLEYKQ